MAESSRCCATSGVEEDPYRSFEDPAAVLSSEIEQTLPSASFAVIAADEQEIRAAVIVSSARIPALEWLTVRRESRERGLATALLARVVAALAARGAAELASGASGANLPSLRWHLTRGFQLAPDPLREALRGACATARGQAPR